MGSNSPAKQALINLISNAIKFTPRGGRISVYRWKRRQPWPDGIGIAADDLQRILQPFVQVGHVQERPHGGSGLGLYLVKSIVEMHGGELKVTSEINEGTIVMMRLPYE